MNNPNTHLIRRVAKELIVELFSISLLTYLVLYLLEDFFAGFVTSVLPLNTVMGVAVVSGIITAAISGDVKEMSPHDAKLQKKIRFRDIAFIVGIGIVAAFLVYYKLRNFGSFAFLIAPLSGMIVILMSFMLLTQEEENE